MLHEDEIPVGSARDLRGLKFNRLTPLYRVQSENERNGAKWHCICECGNECNVRATNLIHGKTKSCGCLQKEHSKTIGKQNLRNLTGQVFNRLTVIERAPNKCGDRHAMWRCKCSCGNEIIVMGKQLTMGRTQSCGCLRKDRMKESGLKRRKDVIGQKFGLLTVIDDAGYDDKHYLLSKCICDCGKEIVVRKGNLICGNTQSCGCLKISHGALKIQQLLENNHIEFIKEFSPLDLEVKNGRFDFAILDAFGDPLYFIEYDGQQHFDNYNGLYQVNREYDLIKNNYCYESGIPLIRIPYYHKNIVLEDILLETSKYVMSTKREDEYYGGVRQG